MDKRNVKKIVFFCLIAIFTASAILPSAHATSWFSRWFGGGDELTLEELVEEGLDAYAVGKYTEAIEAFTRVRDMYPFSRYSMLAELKIADTYYAMEDYEQAIAAYQEFEDLHPQNEVIPYVQYQIGRCYFDQVSTSDRDQGNTRKAMDIFLQLIERFPESVYARRAQAHLKQCEKLIATHELDVGIFYYRTRKYDAAINRLEGVLINYPDVGIHHKALEFLTKSKDAKARELAEADKGKKKKKKDTTDLKSPAPPSEAIPITTESDLGPIILDE